LLVAPFSESVVLLNRMDEELEQMLQEFLAMFSNLQNGAPAKNCAFIFLYATFFVVID
jgi:hypothetical protein